MIRHSLCSPLENLCQELVLQNKRGHVSTTLLTLATKDLLKSILQAVLFLSLVRRASEKKKSARKINRHHTKTGSERCVRNSVPVYARFICLIFVAGFFGGLFHSRDGLSWERGTARSRTEEPCCVTFLAMSLSSSMSAISLPAAPPILVPITMLPTIVAAGPGSEG